MALERIAAIGHVAPMRNPAGPAGRRPAQGETIELTFEAAAADEMLATTIDGVQLKLAGLGAMSQGLTAGDVLVVKVLATTPQLELMLFDTLPRTATGTAGRASPYPFETEQAAMRLDQVSWLRQVVWRPPDPASLATSWRAAMLGQLERQAALYDPAASHEGLAAMLHAEAGIAAPDEHPYTYANPAANPSTANDMARAQSTADPWLLAAYAWGGSPVLLRVLMTNADGTPSRNPRSPAALTLRVTLVIPSLGGVILQLQLAPGGVLLDLAVERAEALQPLRDRLPAIVAAVARAGLRVLRCRLMRGLPGGATPPALARPDAGPAESPAADASAPSRPSPASMLPPALFWAAAEVVAVLCSPNGNAASANSTSASSIGRPLDRKSRLQPTGPLIP